MLLQLVTATANVAIFVVVLVCALSTSNVSLSVNLEPVATSSHLYISLILQKSFKVLVYVLFQNKLICNAVLPMHL